MRGQDLMQPDPCNAGRLEVDRRVHQCAGRLTVLPQQSGGALDPPRGRCPRVREFYPTSSWRSSPAVHAGDRQPKPAPCWRSPYASCGCQAVGDSDRCGAASRRPQPRHRPDGRRDQSSVAETSTAPTGSGRNRDGPPSSHLLTALDTACYSVEDLGRAAAEFFQTHPDYAIIVGFPGLADSTRATGVR